MPHNSEQAHCGGPLGRASLLGTLEDMLRKALDIGISLHMGPFCLRGTYNQKGRLVYQGLLMMNEGWL